MNDRSPSGAVAVLRYLAGWRLGLLVVGFVVGLFAVAIGFEVSAAQLFWGALAALALLGPIWMIVGRAGAVAEARHLKVTDRLAAADRRLGDSPGAVGDTRERLDRLDQVVADAVRKPYSPTTLPFPTPVSRSRPILLLPSASYHLAEIMPLQVELSRLGLETMVAVGEAHWPRIAAGLGWYDTPIYALPDPGSAVEGLGAVVTMKDWAGYGKVVAAAKTAGIPTFAKVEGAQDFDDVDTPYSRAAYRTADHILCQGRNDYDALSGSRYIVGSSRLERLWLAPAMPVSTDYVVINLNFTYGVLEEQRDMWISGAVAACQKLRIPYTVALHPAERNRGDIPRASTIPISSLLLRAGALVSRFSTVPFEAMARGVPFIYHNPHREGVATFATETEAFRTTFGIDDLAAAIEEAHEWRSDYRDRSAGFFSAQVDIDRDRSAAERGARVIADLLASG